MKRHLFSKFMVLYCVLISTAITAAVLRICWKGGEITAGTVTALFGLWGGELLLLCLKRLLGDGSSAEPSGKPGVKNRDL
ncbi:MAG TPA: hypothetical protein PK597_04080 [Oscillospiraceae bacterium]|nr:hypothetical protein [Oscillospiraceae bacterium]